MATTTTAKPDPKPLTKRQQAAEAKRLAKLAEEQAKLDASPSVVEPNEGAAMASVVEAFNEGATIAELARERKMSHADVRSILDTHGVDFSADKNALDLKDRVRQASAATLARRAANEADKAKVVEQKAADRAKRDAAKSQLVASVVAKYGETSSVKATAEAIVNEATGKPFSQTRIRRILIDAGKLESTTRGDTSERDALMVAAYNSSPVSSDERIAALVASSKLSAARVRSILKKGGVAVEGSTRGSKLPTIGTPEWSEFANDVSALCEKWGSALGTMAHAIRRAGSAAGS